MAPPKGMRTATEVVPKLGVKPGMPALRVGGIATYDRPIEHLAGQLDVVEPRVPLTAKPGRYGLVLCFALGAVDLERLGRELVRVAHPDGAVWIVVWKKTRLPPDAPGWDEVQEAGLGTGTVVPVTIAPGVTFTPAPTIPPTPTPSPAPGGLTQAQLKYGLVDRFGRLLFCDPDFYPVARADEQSQADARFAEIQSDAPTFTAIVAHLGIPASGTYSSAQRLAIYRDWKMLNALRLDAVGQGFHFLAIFSGNPAGTGNQGTSVDGTIDQRGTISVASQTPSGPPPCPICLARGTRVATPTGDAAVEDLRVGDLVWTEGVSGARIAAPLVSTC